MDKGKVFVSVLLTDYIEIVTPLVLKVSKDIVPETPATVNIGAIIPFIVCTLLKGVRYDTRKTLKIRSRGTFTNLLE